jgi:hypothetical protein
MSTSVVLQSALGIDHPSPQALAALQSKQQHLDQQRHEMQVRLGWLHPLKQSPLIMNRNRVLHMPVGVSPAGAKLATVFCTPKSPDKTT